MDTYNRLYSSLEITRPDDEAFFYEHGVGALTPFIKKYYPDSNIVPILQREKPLNLELMNKLGNEIADIIEGDTSKYFLLISTDFSHHFALEDTLKHDRRSKKFLLRPMQDNIMNAANDNIGGLYVLAAVSQRVGWKQTKIIYNTNSYYIAEEGEEDITSYFFSFMFN